MKYYETLIHEMLPERIKYDGSVLAVELEAEGQFVPPLKPIKTFRREKDGSLDKQNGMEFVSTEPVPITSFPQHIQDLKDLLADSLIKDSMRTSTHLHINCQDLTQLQVHMLATMIWYFEDVLFAVCAEHRRNNYYCLPLCNSGVVFETIQSYTIHNGSIVASIDDNMRYGNLNLAALRKFGTLELRCLDGALDWERLEYVGRTLNAFRTSMLRDYRTPRDILQDIDTLGTPELMKKWLIEEEIFEFWIRRVPNAYELLDASYTQAYQLCTFDPRWEVSEQAPEKKPSENYEKNQLVKQRILNERKERLEREFDAFKHGKLDPAYFMKNRVKDFHVREETNGIPYHPQVYNQIWNSTRWQEYLDEYCREKNNWEEVFDDDEIDEEEFERCTKHNQEYISEAWRHCFIPCQLWDAHMDFPLSEHRIFFNKVEFYIPEEWMGYYNERAAQRNDWVAAKGNQFSAPAVQKPKHKTKFLGFEPYHKLRPRRIA